VFIELLGCVSCTQGTEGTVTTTPSSKADRPAETPSAGSLQPVSEQKAEKKNVASKEHVYPVTLEYKSGRKVRFELVKHGIRTGSVWLRTGVGREAGDMQVPFENVESLTFGSAAAGPGATNLLQCTVKYVNSSEDAVYVYSDIPFYGYDRTLPVPDVQVQPTLLKMIMFKVR
jgi:hypothetical protein